ncbi:MAG: ribokinase [Ktedonobacterales bacterium]|nr:ribokinase [Ktedonobacterales bacterium]
MPPEIVLVGHVARDLQPDGTYRLGGTVTYAALLAERHALRVGICTSAPAAVVTELQALIPTASIHAVPAATATIFENRYGPSGRVQYLRARAIPLTAAHLPAEWCAVPITLLGPIADEIAPDLAMALQGPVRAATPQGWLRVWDAAGRVSPTRWGSAASIVPTLTDLILSTEDLAIAAGGGDGASQVAGWAAQIPRVVLTDGARGATLWHQRGRTPTLAFPVTEVDPTGAGDTFACAYLIALRQMGDPLAAMRYAHAAASFVVQSPGTSGIPTPEMIAARLTEWRT